MSAQILIINGPNLNLLGRREPEVYGKATLAEIMDEVTAVATELGTSVEHFQSNNEGGIIERIHQTIDDDTRFIIINPGAFTHTSIAIRDAFLSIEKPFIEVHLSNVFAREEFRQHSFLSDIATAVISGVGKKCYELGVRAALAKMESS